MGQNLVLNMNDNGFKVIFDTSSDPLSLFVSSYFAPILQISVFNRTVSKVDAFIENEAKGTEVVGTHSIEVAAT